MRRTVEHIHTNTITFVIFALSLLCLFHEAHSQLDPNRLSVFIVTPGERNWPVIMSASYLDPNIDISEVIFTWSFSGTTDQCCTYNGRPETCPCRNRVVQKAWKSAGTYTVTLSAALSGGPAIMLSRNVTIAPQTIIESPIAQRREIRNLTAVEWGQFVGSLWVLKDNGVYDELVYTHQVSYLVSYLVPNYFYHLMLFIS